MRNEFWLVGTKSPQTKPKMAESDLVCDDEQWLIYARPTCQKCNKKLSPVGFEPWMINSKSLSTKPLRYPMNL